MSNEALLEPQTVDSIAAAPPPTTTTTSNGASLKDTMVNSELTRPSPSLALKSELGVDPLDAAAAVNAVKDHPIAQNIANGPVATSVKNQTAATSNEFSGLASARSAPAQTDVNGEPLTHYHSFFYTLLSWEHPRATGITFGGVIAFIFMCRYLPILRYFFKMTYITLGVVSLAEVIGKLVMGTGFASSIRPRRYYKISKEALESTLDDVEQLINFVVIEVQRTLFAENVAVTIAAFIAAFISYFLIKFLPFWGLTLLSTCLIFLGPLVYVSNKELIDGHLEHATNVVSAQATQVKDLTAHHASKGFESAKAYTSDYTAKATEYVGASRQKIPTMEQAKAAVTGNTANTTGIKQESFPPAPKTDLPSAAGTTVPTEHAPVQAEPIVA